VVDEALLTSFAELEETHWWFQVRRDLVVGEALRWAPQPTRRLLEVGCGTGGTLHVLSTRFPHAAVSGVEPVPAALEAAAARGCDVVPGAFEALPVETGGVDMLLALDVLEHLEDDASGLAEAARVLRPGGRLLVTVPALASLWGPHDELNGHRRRYGLGMLAGRVGGAGFAVERVTYFNCFLLPLAWLERTISRRRGVAAPVKQPPRLANALMRGIFACELPLLRRVDLPVGVSLLLVATRQGEGQP
jgi:SAM-dependent methyltransferase